MYAAGSVAYFGTRVHFWRNTTSEMESKEKIMERFERILESDLSRGGGQEDFCDICRKHLGIPPGAMDEVLLAELGMSGEEIIAEYRRKLRDPIDIGDKFY